MPFETNPIGLKTWITILKVYDTELDKFVQTLEEENNVTNDATSTTEDTTAPYIKKWKENLAFFMTHHGGRKSAPFNELSAKYGSEITTVEQIAQKVIKTILPIENRIEIVPSGIGGVKIIVNESNAVMDHDSVELHKTLNQSSESVDVESSLISSSSSKRKSQTSSISSTSSSRLKRIKKTQSTKNKKTKSIRNANKGILPPQSVEENENTPVEEEKELKLTDIIHVFIDNKVLEQFLPEALIDLSNASKVLHYHISRPFINKGIISKRENLVNALKVRMSNETKTCLFCNQNRARLHPQFGFYMHVSKCLSNLRCHLVNVYYPLKENSGLTEEYLLTLPHMKLQGFRQYYKEQYEYNAVWKQDDGFIPREDTLEGFLSCDITDPELKRKRMAEYKEKQENAKRRKMEESRKKKEQQNEDARKREEKINVRRAKLPEVKEKLRKQAIKQGVQEEVISQYFNRDSALVFGDFLITDKLKPNTSQKQIIQRLQSINQFHERNLLHLLDSSHEINRRNSWLDRYQYNFKTVLQTFEEHFNKSTTNSILTPSIVMNAQAQRITYILRYTEPRAYEYLKTGLQNDPAINNKVFGDYFKYNGRNVLSSGKDLLVGSIESHIRKDLEKLGEERCVTQELLEKHVFTLIGTASLKTLRERVLAVHKFHEKNLHHLLNEDHELNSQDSWIAGYGKTVWDCIALDDSSSWSTEVLLLTQVKRMKSKLQRLTAPTMPSLFGEIFNDPEIIVNIFGDFFKIDQTSRSCNDVNKIIENVCTFVKEKLQKMALEQGVHEETFKKHGVKLIGKCSEDKFMKYLKTANKFHEKNLDFLLDEDHELNSKDSWLAGYGKTVWDYATVCDDSSSWSAEMFILKQVERMKSKLQEIAAPTMPSLFEEIFKDPQTKENVFGDFFKIDQTSRSNNDPNEISNNVYICMKEKLLKMALEQGIHKETFEKYGEKRIRKRSENELMKYLKLLMDRYGGHSEPPFEKFYEEWNGWENVGYKMCKDHLRRFINEELTEMSFTNNNYEDRRWINEVFSTFGLSYSCSHGVVTITRKNDFTLKAPRMLTPHELETWDGRRIRLWKILQRPRQRHNYQEVLQRDDYQDNSFWDEVLYM